MRRKSEDSPFPSVFEVILSNADEEGKWHWHKVMESSFSTMTPTYMYDDESITVYLPIEFRVMRRSEIRSCMKAIIDAAYNGKNLTMSRMIRRFVSSKRCRDERRKSVREETSYRFRRVLPNEFNDAMALHPGLRECLDGMALAIFEHDDDPVITRSDYLSRTILISEDVFKDENRLLRTYIVFRELAGVLSVRPSSDYGLTPIPEIVRKYLYRFPNWWAYERECRRRGWHFRFEVLK